MMEIEEIRQGDVLVLAPQGKLDAAAEGVFEKKLKALLDEQVRFVVVDFGKVDYVSGGALRALWATSSNALAIGTARTNADKSCIRPPM